jgi:hypothetical protein
MTKLLSESVCLPYDETAGAVCDMGGTTVEPEPASGHLMAAGGAARYLGVAPDSQMAIPPPVFIAG